MNDTGFFGPCWPLQDLQVIQLDRVERQLLDAVFNPCRKGRMYFNLLRRRSRLIARGLSLEEISLRDSRIRVLLVLLALVVVALDKCRVDSVELVVLCRDRNLLLSPNDQNSNHKNRLGSEDLLDLSFWDHSKLSGLPYWHLCLAPTGITRIQLFSVDCGSLRQSGPRPDPRLLRQAALEALTRSARTDSPRQVGRKQFFRRRRRRRRRRVEAAAAAA
ncbi:hypothetical protein F511_27464 [Dorcoceras hygrometricum]|uniref:Uncharacterized protein n=1 Tax=Dorcoceras hygrometricum TaxID=472368 RepID=A0A2Z7BUI8_9LAMI|nr:hypothetical protein F511_27464 [Dorcoceras hygrometricum]